MKYCKTCLQPDTRPNIVFDQNGVCPACVYYGQSQDVDWSERFEILRELVQKYKNPHVQYDCIMGVSGGKDSTRQAVWAKEKLGLNPLLTCLSYPPDQMSDIGAANISNLIDLGFDLINISLAPQTWKRFMRVSFLEYANWCKSTELALFSSVPKVALERNVPLILWGENPGLQIGDLSTLGNTGYDGNNLIKSNTLSGGDLSWLKREVLDERDLIPYTYPTKDEFSRANMQIIFLGWFLPNWSLKENGIQAGISGLERRTTPVKKTGELLGVSAIDEDFVIVNQMIKYYKFGFGKITEFVNEMMRSGEISREDGIRMVENYDGVCNDFYIDAFCEYIDISITTFWEIVHKNLNCDLFEVSGNQIKKKFKVGQGIA
jgi:N-acetyl sugar amidotransferase